MGVRGLVRDELGRVLLVRHTYTPGWIFPGGGVERGEDAVTAVIRELEEEAGVESNSSPRLFGLYANNAHFPGDHIAFYQLDDWTQGTATSTLEIKEAGFFAVDELPTGTTGGTKRRLDEVLNNGLISPNW